MNEENPSADKGLCNFCKPRIHDLSRLGWKTKHNSKGGMYLEPDIIILPDGDVDLVPFKDEEAFGPYANDYPKKYGPVGSKETIKGIEASGKHIKIEFFQGFDLPADTSLQGSPLNNREPTVTDCPFCKTLIQALLGARKQRQRSKPWGRRVYIWSLKFRFEPVIVSDLMLEPSILGPKLMLKSLVFEYQPRASIAVCELSVTNMSGQTTWLNIQQQSVVPDLLEPSTISYMKTCLARCNPEDHPLCYHANNTPLPTRVLDIGTGNENQAVKVVETKGRTGQYIAISYCWGTQSSDVPVLKTTTSNLADFAVEIPWSQMPINFKIVISLCRRLGIRNIWIDSLCIIQDNLKDWHMQAANMSNIYMNAHITIAICAALSPHDDIQFRTSPQEFNKIPWIFSPDPSLGGIYLVDATYPPQNKNPFKQDVDMTTWNTRGWTFQERFLSQRIIYLGRGAAYWDCQVGRLHEVSIRSDVIEDMTQSVNSIDTQELEFKNLVFGSNSGGLEYTVKSLYDLWYAIIAEYSKRGLTYGKDILAALAGVAEMMAVLMKRKDSSLDVYYFGGIWEGDLERAILWRTGIPRLRKPFGVFTEFFVPPREDLPAKANCASWLWTSVPLCTDSTPGARSRERRHIFFPFPDEAYNKLDFMPLSLDSTQEPGATKHQFTEPDQDGILEVQGRIKQIPFTATPVSNNPSQEGSKGAFRVELTDAQYDSTHEPNTIRWTYDGSCNWTQEDYDLIEAGNMKLFALCIAIAPPQLPHFSSVTIGVYGILLVPVEGSEVEGRVFRRVGMFIHNGFIGHLNLTHVGWEDWADYYLEHEFGDSELCTFSII